MNKFEVGDYARLVEDDAGFITDTRKGDVVRIDAYDASFGEYEVTFIKAKHIGVGEEGMWVLKEKHMEPCFPPNVEDSSEETYDGAAFAARVDAVLDPLRQTLIEKNAAYGDSALNPVRVFSKAGTEEQIKVRIDDKISRLQRGSEIGEDTVLDLMGYLVLLRIAQGSDD